MTDRPAPADPTPGSPPAPSYPVQWEADVLLADGAVVHIRPSGPDDTDAIRAMHSRLSPRSLYLRYFSVVTEPNEAQLRVFTDVDHVDRVGLVALSGGDVIAAGTYYRNGPADTAAGETAEVAFLVEDGQQRRGLASILLEHLAAAAQERGIRRFTAEVLADNTSMLRVFADAGYTVSREYDSGVVDLGFDIAPTDASRAVQFAREHRAEARSIARLLAPRSIAVIGASTDPCKLGHAALVNLLRANFAGPVYPVNPDTVSVQGVRAYPSVLDIPDEVDVAVLAVPAAGVADVVEGCRAKGVRGLVVMTAGFADADQAGADAQREMVAVARANGMRLLGPNCLGMINTDPVVRMNATLAPIPPAPGRIGFFCQSGALGIAILADVASRGLGLSSFVSAGNRADVSGNDLLQYWVGDDRTDVVLLYLESFGNPRKFARLARTLARSKPVIAVKSGRHAMVTPGLAANSAHLPESTVATLFEQSGVIRTAGLTTAFDVAQLLVAQPVPRGDRVAIVGNSSALGILALDFCLDAGLRVVEDGPIDLGVDVPPAVLAEAVRATVQRSDVDALVVAWVPPVAAPGTAHADALRQAAAGSEIPVVSVFFAVDGLPEHLTVRDAEGRVERGSVPSYRTLERAVGALAHAVTYGAWLRRPVGQIPDLPGIDRARARARMTVFRGDNPGERPLTDIELTELLECYGIPMVPYRAIASAEEAVAAADAIGYPVVLKSFDQSLRHRVDLSGVRLGLADADEVGAAYEDLSAIAGPWLYVQAMAPAGRAELSTAFTISTDPSFGALVSFGIAGVSTDLLGDTAYRAVPLTDTDAADLIGAPRAAPLLRGYRGAQPVDTAGLVDVALRLSALADDRPEVRRLELLPVLVGPGGVAVTSATAVIGPPPERSDARRRLR